MFLAFSQTGCKEYLNVKPIDRLAGNSFFQNRQDVENNLWDIYGGIRDKLGNSPLLPWAGDLRSGMMAPSPQVNGRSYRVLVPMNMLNTIIHDSNIDYWDLFRMYSFDEWAPFYKVVQSANILYYELARKPIEGLSDKDVKHYQAEAVFLRCISYFFMIRLFGDVPYYTDAYHEGPLPRMDMVQVANNCLDDLAKVKDDLPWEYTEPAYRGVRASRGSIIALMMNFDLWNAGFDKANAKKYAKQAADLGKELVDSKAYELLPMKDFHKIFKGRTKEGLFEIAQNSNYGEIIMYQTFPDMVLHFPYKRPVSSHHYSFCYFRSSFLKRIFPPGEPDLRTEYWFDENMMSDDGNFQYLKFTNIYAISDGEDVNPDNNLIIFRYAGAILLRAEALAILGQNDEAIKMLNMVRTRSQATLYAGAGGQPLKDAIFAEQAKELMGEGHYYFDLVRTGRVMDPNWDYYPLTQNEFNLGGWTWPLDPAAQYKNPYVQLNTYWLR